MRKQREKKLKEQMSSTTQSSNEYPAPLESSFISSQSFGKAKQSEKESSKKSREEKSSDMPSCINTLLLANLRSTRNQG